MSSTYPTTVGRVLATLVVLLAALGLSACASEGPARPKVAAPSQPRTADVAAGSDVRFSAAGSGGARLGLSLRIGSPRPVGTVQDEGVEACRFLLDGFDAAEDAVAVPITVTADVPTDAPPTDVTVGLSSIFLPVGDGVASDSAADAVWAVQYRSVAPQCRRGPNDATVRWDPIASGQRRTWSTWMVLYGEAASTPGAVLLRPQVRVDQILPAALDDLEPSGEGHVRCRIGEGSSPLVDFVAVDGDEALEAGCLTAAGHRSTPITDRICFEQYPGGGTSRQVDGAMTFDRVGSLHQMCEGFGVPSGVQVTPGMKCALLAAVATLAAHPATSQGLNRLCDTQSVVEAYASGAWIEAAGSKGCDFMADGLGGAAGVLAAGGTAATGAGAAAAPVIGLVTYKALSAALKVACGGIFEGGARSLGERLQGNHEAHVRRDIYTRGKCLQIKADSQPAAVTCPT